MGSDPVTQLLARWGEGDDDALNELAPLVYDRLHQLAHSAYRHERGAQTLQATAVVNEAWMKIASADLDLEDRHHFYALASRTMRRILVNHALARKAAKRGGGQVLLTLHENNVSGSPEGGEVLALHEALEALSKRDADLSEVLELHYFGGYSAAEIAEARAVSLSTAKRQLRFARAWMGRYLKSGDGESREQEREQG